MYTIDSVMRLHDAEVYEAKVERKRIADSMRACTGFSYAYTRWIESRQYQEKIT